MDMVIWACITSNQRFPTVSAAQQTSDEMFLYVWFNIHYMNVDIVQYVFNIWPQSSFLMVILNHTYPLSANHLISVHITFS